MLDELGSQLQKQLGFLARSCRDYDLGESDEAIRIATTIRVLIHQTSKSTSLLKHLNLTTINLLSTVREIPPKTLHAMSMCTFTSSSDGTFTYKPLLNESGFQEFVPVSKWWNQVILVSEGKYITRKKIVLEAANTDGGAHVNTKKDAAYSIVSANGFAGTVSYTTVSETGKVELENTHLMCLRQMGYELLNSPELCAQ